MKYLQRGTRRLIGHSRRFLFSAKTVYLSAVVAVILQPLASFAIPAQPANLKASGNPSQPTLSWDAVNGQATTGGEWVKDGPPTVMKERFGHTTAVFDNKLWVMGGYNNGSALNDVWSSTDGITWTEATASAGWSARGYHTTAVFDNKLWVMGGYGSSNIALNDVWSSTDGITWTEATASANWSARGHYTTAVFDNKLWVMGGYYYDQTTHSTIYFNDVWSSTDGITWTEATASANWSARGYLTTAVFDNKLWVIGGSLNDVWYSSDGVTWIEATANANWSARHGHTTVVFDNKLWVMGGWDDHTGSRLNDVWSSTDGITWTEATASAQWSARGYHTTAVFDNKLWVIDGDTSSGPTNDVWYSSDGIIWSQPPQEPPAVWWSARREPTTAVFDNKLWVMGGRNNTGNALNDVWSSPDGINWTEATASAAWPVRREFTSLVFDNKMWVMGGLDSSYNYLNDVWSSPDGITWTKATDSAAWPARSAFTSLVFDNKMWVIGGESDSTDSYLIDDVWSSSDGINWTQVQAHAAFGERGYGAATVFDNKMWVMGGDLGPDWDTTNDVWSSTDGITWTEATASANWSARGYLTTAVFDNKMWVMGGYDSNLNDVWSTPDRTISHYKLCWDTVQSGCRNTATSPTASYTVNQTLSPGTWYFSVAAVNGENEESVLSDSITLVVPGGTSLPISQSGLSNNSGGNTVLMTPAASSSIDNGTTPSPSVKQDAGLETTNQVNSKKSSTNEQSGSTLPFVLAIAAVIVVTGWLIYHYARKRKNIL